MMIVGDRLRMLRDEKNMSQGDIEARAGLKRCYISRVENGHTVPSLETLERWARALGIPLYEVFYDGEKPPLALPVALRGALWGLRGKHAHLVQQFRKAFSRLSEEERKLVLHMSRKMARSAAAPRKGGA